MGQKYRNQKTINKMQEDSSRTVMILEFSVLFLFMYIYLVSSSVLSSPAFCEIHALVFPSHVSVFLCDLSQLFGYFRNSGIFLELGSLLVFWNFPLLS